ncbi:3'-5' exonuclease [Nocardia sp. IFM 10818]
MTASADSDPCPVTSEPSTPAALTWDRIPAPEPSALTAAPVRCSRPAVRNEVPPDPQDTAGEYDTVATVPAAQGRDALAEAVGLQRWQLELAIGAGMLRGSRRKRRWSHAEVEQIGLLVPAIVERFGATRPLGATRAAACLSERLGYTVAAADIAPLIEAGDLPVFAVYVADDQRRHDLVTEEALHEVPGERVGVVVATRRAWEQRSCTPEQACRRLGWQSTELTHVLAERQITAGPLGRLARETVDALLADAPLRERVRRQRPVTGAGAAALLDLDRRHFDLAVEAGWITACGEFEKSFGRRRTVAVPLYRTAEVEDLLLRPVDWLRVRACAKGAPSPLLAFVGRRQAVRAKVIRRFVDRFTATHGVEMWAWYTPERRVWEIDWDSEDGIEEVEAALAADASLDPYRSDLRLRCGAGAAIRFARDKLVPGRACLLDTETTSLFGAVCEISVIDAATGETLLDTLVNPGGIPIEPEAQQVHGLSDADVTAEGVPLWPAVHERLVKAVGDRLVLAYNAGYDRTVTTADSVRYGIDSPLADPERWSDLMAARSAHARTRQKLRNGGGHRSLGDIRQSREHLLRMSVGP